MDNKRSIEKHYGRGGIRDAILNALSRAGKDLTRLSPIDLAPVDEFHVRGRDATVELAGPLDPRTLILGRGNDCRAKEKLDKE